MSPVDKKRMQISILPEKQSNSLNEICVINYQELSYLSLVGTGFVSSIFFGNTIIILWYPLTLDEDRSTVTTLNWFSGSLSLSRYCLMTPEYGKDIQCCVWPCWVLSFQITGSDTSRHWAMLLVLVSKQCANHVLVCSVQLLWTQSNTVLYYTTLFYVLSC